MSSWPAIGDDAEEVRPPAGVRRVVGAVTTGADTAGSSVWIAIGTLSTHIGSSHNTAPESRSAVTWTIDEIAVRS